MSTRRSQSTGRLEPMAMLSPLFDPAQGPPPQPRPADSMLGVLPGSPASGVHLFARGWAFSVVAAGSGRLVWESCSCRRTGLWPGPALKAVGAETQAQASQRGVRECAPHQQPSARGPPVLSRVQQQPHGQVLARVSAQEETRLVPTARPPAFPVPSSA